MFDKREYFMYPGVARKDIYPQVCRFWAEHGFYVSQISPFEIQGQSYHQRIGLRREFFLRLNEAEGTSYIELNFTARITDEGMLGGVAATIIFFPVALVGGALSYHEYKKEATDLMERFWAFVDQVTSTRGSPVQAPPPFTPPNIHRTRRCARTVVPSCQGTGRPVPTAAGPLTGRKKARSGTQAFRKGGHTTVHTSSPLLLLESRVSHAGVSA